MGSMIDAMDDNKSHMSELTEDRTQRHFEAAFLNFNQQQQHALSSGSPRMMMIPASGRGKLDSSSPRGSFSNNFASPSTSGGPPSLILGGDTMTPNTAKRNDSHGSNEQQHGQEQDRLETIQSSAISLPPGPITPRFRQRYFQQQQHHREMMVARGVTNGGGDAVTVSMDHNLTSPGGYRNQQQSSPRLSVAERARLEADRSSTPVRVRIDDEKVQASLQKARSSASLAGSFGMTANTTPVHSSNISASGNSQGSGLWRRMEEAVLGPRPDDDDDSSVHSTRVTDYTESDVCSTRVTDYTEDSSPDKDRFLQQARRRLREQKQQLQPQSTRNGIRPPPRQRSENTARAGSNSEATPEEKKVQELSPQLSLQERSQLLRAKQLQFLKEQGLIKDEQDVRGGAGASPGKGNSDTASVASTGISLPRSTASLPGSRSASRGFRR